MDSARDEDLANTCLRMARAAKDALAWVGDNAKLVGPARSGLERCLKRHVVEATRLAIAARRPMSAAVFGPSQAGKSFLIGKFITPPGRPTRVVFEGEALDFLSQVNPQGGKETTGLVTRFSTTTIETPPGFPVVLRLLREIDLVKILVNTFVLDLSGSYESREHLSANWVGRLVAEVEPRVESSPTGGLCMEDVLEAREYLEERLPSHPYVQLPEVAEAYWPAMERLLPCLPLKARIRALSPLWGALPELDALFADLKSALDQLGHAPVVFAQMDSIRDTSAGVLHVDRIYELSQTGGPGAQTVRLALEDGTHVTLRKSVVTALTSELRVTLDSTPWPFLEHTDLLDFPGARSREASSVEKYLRRPFKAGSEKPPREHCFLRGKVAVLFDNYVADLDLNAMLLCIADSNLEIRTLPELIEGWVQKTHGRTPQERAGRITSLLFCMTKCDRLFDLAAGAGIEQQIENRFRTNFDEFPGWTREWHPGRAFDNTFLLRNPKAIEQRGVFHYEGAAANRVVRDEAALMPDFETRLLPTFYRALADNRTAVTHIADLDGKMAALMSLNDGGTSYLAQALSPVCDPDLKHQQIRPRVQALAVEMKGMLAAYYDEDDIKARVDGRTRRAVDAFRTMASRVNPALGLLLHELGVEEAALRQAYFEYSRRDGKASAVASAAVKPAARNDFGIDLDALESESHATAGAPALPPRETYGGTAVGRWLEGLMRKASDPSLTGRFGLAPEQFQVFVDELRSGAKRLGLIERIDLHADRLLGYRQALPATAAAVALGASLIINDFISDAGRRLMEDHPDPELAARARTAFSPPPALAPGQLPTLPEEETALGVLRRQYPTEWTKAFLAFTRENAASTSGRLVDPEQNARLGAILTACSL